MKAGGAYPAYLSDSQPGWNCLCGHQQLSCVFVYFSGSSDDSVGLHGKSEISQLHHADILWKAFFF